MIWRFDLTKNAPSMSLLQRRNCSSFPRIQSLEWFRSPQGWNDSSAVESLFLQDFFFKKKKKKQDVLQVEHLKRQLLHQLNMFWLLFLLSFKLAKNQWRSLCLKWFIRCSPPPSSACCARTGAPASPRTAKSFFFQCEVGKRLLRGGMQKAAPVLWRFSPFFRTSLVVRWWKRKQMWECLPGVSKFLSTSARNLASA